MLYRGDIQRGLVQFIDGNNTLLRQISFANSPGFNLSTLESSAYVQDRWSPCSGW